MGTWVKRLVAGMALVMVLNASMVAVVPNLAFNTSGVIGIMGESGPERLW